MVERLYGTMERTTSSRLGEGGNRPTLKEVARRLTAPSAGGRGRYIIGWFTCYLCSHVTGDMDNPVSDSIAQPSIINDSLSASSLFPRLVVQIMAPENIPRPNIVVTELTGSSQTITRRHRPFHRESSLSPPAYSPRSLQLAVFY